MNIDPKGSNDDMAGEQLFASLAISFKRLLNAYKQQWLTSKKLIAADIELTLKAMLLCLICVLLISGIILTSWITINIAIVYWLYSLGFYWFVAVTVFLLMNTFAFFMLKRAFKTAKRSLNINTSLAVLFGEPEQPKE